jgi:hypothetical protein
MQNAPNKPPRNYKPNCILPANHIELGLDRAVGQGVQEFGRVPRCGCHCLLCVAIVPGLGSDRVVGPALAFLLPVLVLALAIAVVLVLAVPIPA